MQHKPDSNTPPAQQQHTRVITQMAKHLLSKATVNTPHGWHVLCQLSSTSRHALVIELHDGLLHAKHTQPASTATSYNP
jgi:hypothetical protein